jgi:hypothetical protein
MFYKQDGDPKWFNIWVTIFIGICFVVGSLMFVVPKYNVWAAHLHGQAEFAKAEQNRRIAVLEAQAKMDSAKLLGEAEVARAHGLAEANQIVGQSLGGAENYIRYLWIQQIDKVSGQIIYIPTEAGLPLLEAGKR